MGITTSDFESREAKLQKEATAIRARLSEIEALIKRIREAQQTMRDLGMLSDAPIPTADELREIGEDLARLEEESSQKRTARDSIRGALQYGPLWQLAVDIRQRIQNVEGRDIPMSTLSPTLTKMKDDGEVVRHGPKEIALRSRVEIEEPGFFNVNGEAEASPETADVGSTKTSPESLGDILGRRLQAN